MAGNIRISPKHGLNPTIPVCFFCGKEKHEVAVCGKINNNDDEMPFRAVINYEPCDSCREHMKKGITLIGMSEKPVAKNMPPLTKKEGRKFYPTGIWCVMTDDGIKRLVGEEAAAAAIETRAAFIESDDLKKIIENSKEGDAKTDADTDSRQTGSDTGNI